MLGAGCKRGIDAAFFEERVLEFLRMCGVSLLSVRALATIARKADEPALTQFSKKYDLPLLCYCAKELKAAVGVFAHSEYVEKTVGVDNVCERAARLACGGRLLMGKTKYDGMTLALAGEENL